MQNCVRFRSRMLAVALMCLGYFIGSSHVTHDTRSTPCQVTGSFAAVRQTYDMIDIGANQGGSTNFMQQALRQNVAGLDKVAAINSRTLGIDKDPRKVALALSNNVDCIQADILGLTPDVLNRVCGRPVLGATMWHVLEHMPNCALAIDIWHRVGSLVNQFSSFRGPCFDDKEILLRHGLHRFYEDWHGHTCHFDSHMLVEAIRTAEKKPYASVVILTKKILNSDSDVLLPKGSARDSQRYDPTNHPRKSFVELHSPVWEEMRGCAVYEHGKLSIQSALCLKDALKPFYNGEGDESRVVYCSSIFAPSAPEDCIRHLTGLVDRSIERTNEMSAWALHEESEALQRQSP